jgi:hypothetical protein
MKNGTDMSGLQMSKTDWNSYIEQAKDRLKEGTKLLDEELEIRSEPIKAGRAASAREEERRQRLADQVAIMERREDLYRSRPKPPAGADAFSKWLAKKEITDKAKADAQSEKDKKSYLDKLDKAENVINSDLKSKDKEAQLVRLGLEPDDFVAIKEEASKSSWFGLRDPKAERVKAVIDAKRSALGAAPLEGPSEGPYGASVEQDGITYVWNGVQYVESK